MLNWDDVRFFLALARAGNTVAAGKALRVNASTVARRVQGLEETLSVRLFDRDGVRYRLTDTAHQLLSEAEQVEAAVHGLERRAVLSEQRAAGTLRLTCTEGTAIFMLRPVLRRFSERYPDITVNVLVSDQFVDIARGEADVALRIGRTQDENLVGRKLAELRWGLYASPRYLEQHGTPAGPEALDRHRVIGYDGQLRDIMAARWLRQHAPDRAFTTACDTLTGIIMVANAGTGIALLPMQLGEKESGLCRIDAPVKGIITPMWVLMHRDMRLVPRIRAFVDFMVTEMRDHGEELLGHPLYPMSEE